MDERVPHKKKGELWEQWTEPLMSPKREQRELANKLIVYFFCFLFGKLRLVFVDPLSLLQVYITFIFSFLDLLYYLRLVFLMDFGVSFQVTRSH